MIFGRCNLAKAWHDASRSRWYSHSRHVGAHTHPQTRTEWLDSKFSTPLSRVHVVNVLIIETIACKGISRVSRATGWLFTPHFFQQRHSDDPIPYKAVDVCRVHGVACPPPGNNDINIPTLIPTFSDRLHRPSSTMDKINLIRKVSTNGYKLLTSVRLSNDAGKSYSLFAYNNSWVIGSEQLCGLLQVSSIGSLCFWLPIWPRYQGEWKYPTLHSRQYYQGSTWGYHKSCQVKRNHHIYHVFNGSVLHC